MPMEYSDEVMQTVVDRVRAGETVKAVSRDLRIPPKRIREWVASEDAFRRLKQLVNDLPPELRAALESSMLEGMPMLQQERTELLGEEYPPEQHLKQPETT